MGPGPSAEPVAHVETIEGAASLTPGVAEWLPNRKPFGRQ
jgi:hypothetical protein